VFGCHKRLGIWCGPTSDSVIVPAMGTPRPFSGSPAQHTASPAIGTAWGGACRDGDARQAEVSRLANASPRCWEAISFSLKLKGTLGLAFA
jgi:hypothetical protein